MIALYKPAGLASASYDFIDMYLISLTALRNTPHSISE